MTTDQTPPGAEPPADDAPDVVVPTMTRTRHIRPRGVRGALLLLLVLAGSLLVVPLGAAPASAKPAYCDGVWRKTGQYSIGGKTSRWITTASNGWDKQQIQFRVTHAYQYRRYHWNGTKCVTQKRYDKSAKQYRTKGCKPIKTCGNSPWKSQSKWRWSKWRKHLGTNYGYDPARQIWRYGW